MRIAARRRACTRGPLISAEGIPGAGKTYLTSHAVNGLDGEPLVLDGFSERDQRSPDLGRALLRALRAASEPDPFLRGGAPAAEALLLFAIKRNDFDMVLPELSGGRSVIEGRSVDTTAVCQAAQLHPGLASAALDEAASLVRLAASFRPLPDLTILITGDASAAIEWAERRDTRRFTPGQVAFLTEICALHEALAATDPVRYRVLDRRRTDSHEAIQQVREWILEARQGLTCASEPWQSPGAACIYCGHRTEPVQE